MPVTAEEVFIFNLVIDVPVAMEDFSVSFWIHVLLRNKFELKNKIFFIKWCELKSLVSLASNEPPLSPPRLKINK